MTVQRWAYGGVILNTDNHGKLYLEDLKEFVAAVEELIGGADDHPVTIRPYANGLRATGMTGEAGPHIDWRD